MSVSCKIKPNILSVVFLAIFGCMMPAQPASANSQEANTYYEQAQAAYSNQNYSDAVDYLKKAYRAEPDLVYKYNQIIAIGKLGREREALQLLRTYESELKTDSRINDIAELERRLRDQLQQKKVSRQRARRAARSVRGSAKHTVLRYRIIRKSESKRASTMSTSSSQSVKWWLAGTSAASLATAGVLATGVFLPDGLSDRKECWNDNADRLNFTELNQRCYDGSGTDRAQDIRVETRNSTLQTTFLVIGATSGVGAVITHLLEPPTSKADDESKSVRLSPVVGRHSAKALLRFDF